MNAETQPKSPFNFVQVLIAAAGTGFLNVITYFIGSSAGASMVLGENSGERIGFAQVYGFTLLPILILGAVVFVIGRAKPGFCKVAQWLGLIVAVVSIILPIMAAGDIATALTLSIIHLFVGLGLFFAVHYGNKSLHAN